MPHVKIGYLNRFRRPVRTFLGAGRPPCFDKIVQWIPKFINGLGIDKAVSGSGSEVGREGQNGAYFEGNGTRYVTFSDAINLGTQHTIEFEAVLNSLTELILGGQLNNYVASLSSGRIRYQVGSGNVAEFNVAFDGNFHKYRIVRDNLNVLLYIDDSSTPIAATLNTNTPYSGLAGLFSSGTSFVFTGNCSYIQLTNSAGEVTRFNFEESNTDNKVIGVSPNGPVVGEIQNATGADRLSTTDRRSYLDDNGYVVAKALGKNLFNKDAAESDTSLTSSGSTVTLVGKFTSDFIFVEPNTSYTGFDNSNRTFFYTSDKVAIEELFVSTTISPSNAKYVRFTTIDANLDTIQIEVGTTPTTYEPWEGLHYLDDGGNSPIPDGVKLPVLNGTTQAYLADGTQPSALSISGFSGPLKANLRVVDGVVDNVYSLEILSSNWVHEDGTLIGTADGSAHTFLYSNTAFKDNTAYTIVYTVISNTTDGTGIALSSNGFTGTTESLTENIGENRYLVTSANPITNTDARFFLSSSNATGEIVLSDDIRIYEGDYVTGTPPLPVSGEAVSGNSLINETTKYDVVQADLLTTVQMFDHADPDNVVAIPVAVDDFIDNDNPRLSRIENGEIKEQILNDQVLVEPCLSAQERYLGF